MKTLTSQEIEELASRDTVKRIAVENFLSSLDSLTKDNAISNLKKDARLYRWNAETVRAIRDGIVVAFKRNK